MAFKIFPTSIAGVQLPFNQLKGPLAKLWNKSSKPNLYYPQDIGNNPAHCHVVQISIYEYTTGLGKAIESGINLANNTSLGQAADSIKKGAADGTAAGKQLAQSVLNKDYDSAIGMVAGAGDKVATVVQQVYDAKTYKPVAKTESLANISLYMPDTLNTTYSAGYTDVQMTQVLGRGGFVSSAISEVGSLSNIAGKSPTDVLKQLGHTATAKQIGIKALGKAGSLLGMEGAEAVAGQALGQIVNPQLQLLYTGVDFRTFQLDFMFTPKSSIEAQTTKQIIDTLVYYSSPGLAGDNTDKQQQYLTTPQLFNVKFLFTGKTGVVGAISSVFNKALTNIGLDFLTNKQNDLSADADKNINKNLFSIGDCVLVDVNVDYAPNGWATFDDGHPVATRVTLTFKETNIVTKERLKSEGKSPVGTK